MQKVLMIKCCIKIGLMPLITCRKEICVFHPSTPFEPTHSDKWKLLVIAFLIISKLAWYWYVHFCLR